MCTMKYKNEDNTSEQSCIKYSTNKYQYQYKYCAQIIGTQLHYSCAK